MQTKVVIVEKTLPMGDKGKVISYKVEFDKKYLDEMVKNFSFVAHKKESEEIEEFETIPPITEVDIDSQIKKEEKENAFLDEIEEEEKKLEDEGEDAEEENFEELEDYENFEKCEDFDEEGDF